MTPEPTEYPGVLAPRGSGRILIVDDYEDAADLLCEFLSSLGFEVRVAHNGVAALAISADFCPTVCLLDLDLPEMDGYEVALRLRAMLPAPIKLLAVTGYGSERDRLKTLSAGFHAHMVKPIDLDELMSLLRP